MIALKILLTLIGFGTIGYNIYCSFKADSKSGDIAFNFRRGIGGSIGILAAMLILLPAIGFVPAGHRGVVLKFGAVTDRVLNEGLYVVTPVAESVELMDVQIHAMHAPASAGTKDLQTVTSEITLNYRVNPERVSKVYQDLRRDYEARIVTPAIQEAIKASTAHFDAERLIAERPAVRDKIVAFLTTRLAEHGLLIDAMSITDFTFDPQFAAAIEAKVTATQQALQAQNDLKRVEFEAQQRVAQAKAEAEAIRIQADAITRQGGAEYVRLKAVEKWNGTLPQFLTGSSEVPFLLNVK